MENPFGIYDKTYNLIMEVLEATSEVEAAFIFGSRAMGNHKKGSDVDIAVSGSKINPKVLMNLKSKLNEELPIPYFVDVVHIENTQNEALKTHIMKFGKKFYTKHVNST